MIFTLHPAPEEQKRIVEHLNEAAAQIDASIARTGGQIDLLEEYRTRLIADVVTGKLDVRGATARLPDEGDGQDPIDEGSLLADGMDGDSHGPDEAAEGLAMESEVSV